MAKIIKYSLKCVSCDKEFEPKSSVMTCPECGEFRGTLDVIYPYDEIKSSFTKPLSFYGRDSVYESLLPIMPYDNPACLPPVPVGSTPIFESPALSKILGLNNLWLKDDSRNPSASLKDRASATTLAMANESGASVIAVASTGNAASSLATLAASMSITAMLFVPKTIPRPKLAQLTIHGAKIICLDCDYDSAFDLCQLACKRFGWYNRNTAVNPYTGEGKKTAALEIACSLGESPDVVICPVGDGCILSGIYKGFWDLRKLGLIDKIPRLYGVQASGSAPLVKAFESGNDITPIESVNTIADSISVGYPRDGVKAMRAVKNSSGKFITVSDDQIVKAQQLAASKGGVFVEPAAAAAIAGLLSLNENNEFSKNEKIVTLLTGHGLKDIDTVIKNTKTDIEIMQPDIDIITEKIEKTIRWR